MLVCVFGRQCRPQVPLRNNNLKEELTSTFQLPDSISLPLSQNKGRLLHVLICDHRGLSTTPHGTNQQTNKPNKPNTLWLFTLCWIVFSCWCEVLFGASRIFVYGHLEIFKTWYHIQHIPYSILYISYEHKRHPASFLWVKCYPKVRSPQQWCRQTKVPLRTIFLKTFLSPHAVPQCASEDKAYPPWETDDRIKTHHHCANKSWIVDSIFPQHFSANLVIYVLFHKHTHTHANLGQHSHLCLAEFKKKKKSCLPRGMRPLVKHSPHLAEKLIDSQI